MTQKILPLLLLGLLAACGAPKDNNSNASTTKDSTKTAPAPIPAVDTTTKIASSSNQPNDNAAAEADEELHLDLSKDGRYIGVFEEATVYAGSIDFAFKIGKTLKLLRIESQKYYDIEDGKKVAGFDLPADLIDPSEDLEGPPGANPKVIGKKYEILLKGGNISVKAL